MYEELIKKWQKSGVNLAKSVTNYDTGNLVENAIQTYRIKNGFVIIWNEANAYYVKFVNDGFTHYITGNEYKGRQFDKQTAEGLKALIEANVDFSYRSPRASTQTLKRREGRLRKSQEIWKRRTYNIADRTTRFRRGR